MHVFHPQSISNLLWAFATLGECPDAALLQSLAGHTLHLLRDFSPQNLSNVAWSLATLKDCTDCTSVQNLHKVRAAAAASAARESLVAL